MNAQANEKWLGRMFSTGMIISVFVALLVAGTVLLLTKNLLATALTLLAIFTAGLTFTGAIWQIHSHIFKLRAELGKEVWKA